MSVSEKKFTNPARRMSFGDGPRWLLRKSGRPRRQGVCSPQVSPPHSFKLPSWPSWVFEFVPPALVVRVLGFVRYNNLEKLSSPLSPQTLLPVLEG